jgi:hypothetical protein
MSLRPEPRDRDEMKFTSELGWLAAMACVIAGIAATGGLL